MATLSEKIRGKLMDPLKNALLGAALAISPGLLTRASEERLTEAVQKMEKQIGKDIEKNYEEMMEDFGPKTGPAKTPDRESESKPSETAGPPAEDASLKDNFTPKLKDDIIKPPNAQKAPPSTKDEASSGPQKSQELTPENPEEVEENKTDETTQNTEISPENELSPEEKEQQKLEQEKAKIKQRGTLTKGINQVRFRREIKELKRQKQILENAIKTITQTNTDLEKSIKKDTAKRESKIRKRRNLGIVLRPLQLFNWSCGCCVFFFLTSMTSIASGRIAHARKILLGEILVLRNKIKGIKKQIQKNAKRIQKLRNDLRKVEIGLMKIQNQSLLSSSPETNR